MYWYAVASSLKGKNTRWGELSGEVKMSRRSEAQRQWAEFEMRFF